MFGHPAGNTFALVSSICWLLSDEAYCCVITRNGAISQVFEYMRGTVKTTCFSHRQIDENTINSRKGADDPKSCGVPPRVIRLGNLKNMWKKGMEHGSLHRIAIGECLVPDIKSPFFRITDIEITQDNAQPIGK